MGGQVVVGVVAVLSGLLIVWRVSPSSFDDDEDFSWGLLALGGVLLAVMGAMFVGSAFVMSSDEVPQVDVVFSNTCDFHVVVSDGELPLGVMEPGASDRLTAPRSGPIYAGASFPGGLEIDVERFPTIELTLDECRTIGS